MQKEGYAMKTRITELLGIKVPILQGAMAWVSEANLTAAVSNAGGAGVIATGGRMTEWVRDEIRKAYPQVGEITITALGVVIGAHCGPGLLTVFYLCNGRQPK